MGGGFIEDPEALAVVGFDAGGGEGWVAEFEDLVDGFGLFFAGDEENDIAGGIQRAIGQGQTGKG